MGNYLYCCACICAALKISKQRLARQRSIRCQQSKNPIVEMMKEEVDNGSIVHIWRESVATKYSKVPGIRNLHDFIFSKHLLSGEVVARTRGLCYDGPFRKSSMHILAGQTDDNIVPGEDRTYVRQNRTQELSDSKMNHLKQMYREFIHRNAGYHF